MSIAIRIGTRGSALALWQARFIASRLRDHHPGAQVDVEVIHTTGDRVLDRQLKEIGGKGLFTKEIEDALLEGRVDLAVHSLKDMPWEGPAGLRIAVVPERASAWDVLCPREPGNSLRTLPAGARIGTGSLRRMTQILHLRPDLVPVPIRGNVQTRLDKRSPERDDLDAVILAQAGLERLGIHEDGFVTLQPPEFLPAPGQGALALQVRDDDSATLEAIVSLEHEATRLCVEAERAALHAVEGNCHTPFAAWAHVEGDTLHLEARLLDEDGRATTRSDAQPRAGAEGIAGAHALGRRVADAILSAHGPRRQG